MTINLESRIRDAESVLGNIDTILVTESGKIQRDVLDSFLKISRYKNECKQWIEIIDARKSVVQFINDLENRIDTQGSVLLGQVPIPFRHARIIGVQAYLTTTWSLADRICGLAGLIFCPYEKSANLADQPQLMSHFVKEEARKTASSSLQLSMRMTFGWPIGLSYAIRNHFVHDGGKLDGSDFFESNDPETGFRISEEGWKRVEKRARSYGIDPSYQRHGGAWLPSPREDLRAVFLACENETDEALGVLIGSACQSIKSHIGFMIGET